MLHPDNPELSLKIYEIYSNNFTDNHILPEDQIVSQARELAQQAHNGQLRKTSGKPFLSHLETVAAIVADFSISPIVIAAAFLHDLIEDTDYTYEDIVKLFGKSVADLVLQVTEDKNMDVTSRRIKYLSGLKDPEAILISGADKLHNALSLLASVDFSEFKNPIAGTLAFYKQVADLVFNVCPQLAIDLQKAIILVEKKVAKLPNLVQNK